MDKLSEEKVALFLADAAAALRTVTAERDTALAKLAEAETTRRVEKLARDMQEKGLSSEPTEYIMQQLKTAADEGRLGNLESAVEMVGPDMWSKFAHPTDDAPGAHGPSSLEIYLASQA